MTGEPSVTPEPVGTSRCDVCGIETPHSHSPWEVEQERHTRPAFEELLAYHTTDSDGHPRTIKPHRAIGPHSRYTTMLDTKLPDKWFWFSAGWYEAWKRGSGVTKP